MKNIRFLRKRCRLYVIQCAIFLFVMNLAQSNAVAAVGCPCVNMTDGECIEYWPLSFTDGKQNVIMSNSTCKDGKIDGVFKMFDSGGHFTNEWYYKNGDPYKSVNYDKSGNAVRADFYQSGKENGSQLLLLKRAVNMKREECAQWEPSDRIIPPYSQSTSLSYVGTLNGKVIDAITHKPLSATKIFVVTKDFSFPMPNGFLQKTTTNARGNFSINLKHFSSYLIAVAKGYHPVSLDPKIFIPFTIKLFPVIDPQGLVCIHADVGVTADGEKYGFRFLEPVGEYDEGPRKYGMQNVDMYVDDWPPKKLIAVGQGGFIPISREHGDSLKFYNTFEAPEAGYQKELLLGNMGNGMAYFRTADGKHYGKLEVVGKGEQYGDNGSKLYYKNISFSYVVQPEENNRNLELLW